MSAKIKDIAPVEADESATTNTKNLYQRMSAVMEDVKRLQKDKQVGSGNYSYRAMSEEKVATTLRTAMIKHGLVLFPVNQVHTLVDHVRADRNGVATTVSLSTVDVQYKLVNIDCPSEFEIIASSGTGVDPQDKGVGKAMTYSMKYALMRAFLIPTGEDPDDIHNEDLARQQHAHQPAAQPVQQPVGRAQVEQGQPNDGELKAYTDMLRRANSTVELRELFTTIPKHLAQAFTPLAKELANSFSIIHE